MHVNSAITKLAWADIRSSIEQINDKFAGIVDSISPDDSFTIYRVDYPYGAVIADTENFYLPDSHDKPQRINSFTSNQDLLNDLSYGQSTMPMGMVLSKTLEYYIDLPKINMIIPWLIYKPGSLFPYTTILGNVNYKNYAPNNLLAISAGARSAFMLPNIGCNTNHINIQRDLNIQKSAPKFLYEHWDIFKQIANSKVAKSDWRCSVIYFAEKWVSMLQNDTSWLSLKNYMLESGWKQFEFERNRVYFDIAFSFMQQKRNLKPNPYLTDTARHLHTIAMGCAPGYAPAIDDDFLPVELLQNVYMDSYGLKKYIPTILQPQHFDITSSNQTPVYYSLQHPSTHMFSPKSRKASSTLLEMRELSHIMKIFSEELTKDNAICSDTILNTIARDVNYEYFHNEVDAHLVIKSSAEVKNMDPRFSTKPDKPSWNNATFAEDAKFLRGCVRIG